MDPTDNHNYNRPDTGDKNWDVDLNQNFNDIDSDMPIRDTEANKGNYTPQEDLKFEATDSGAVYYGNGDSWVLVDRKVNSLSTSKLNRTYTPRDNSLEAIQEIVENADTQVIDIRLEPGTLYTGDTQIQLNSIDSDGTAREIHVNARGAGIHYTGSESSAVTVHQGELGNSRHDGRVTIEYGSWYYGPDTDGDTAVIRIDDTFGADIRPTRVQGAENGIICVNNEQWCESVHLGIRRTGEYSGDDAPSVRQPLYYIRACGGESDFPDANGTASFRDADITIPWQSARDGGGITFWQDQASFHGGEILIRGFCPDGGSLYRVDGGAYGATAYVESEGGDQDSTAIEMNTHSPPVFINPRLAVNDEDGENWQYSGSSWPTAYTNTGIIKPDGTDTWGSNNQYISWSKQGSVSHVSLDLHVENNVSFSWNYNMQQFYDDDENLYAAFSPYRDDFTIQHSQGGGLRVVDSEENPGVIRGDSFHADGDGRAFLGTYAEHPDAEPGSTWYCDGSGSNPEGFYGQTSSGPVQIN